MPQIVLDGKYRLDEPLGEGATGVVYRALHLGLKKSFAVKLLKTGSPDPLSLARFRREAEALGQLRHPHVVAVTDFGIDVAAGEIPYLVMELLEGITLADFCREHGPLPLSRALPLLEAIAAAVDAAHAQGVLHRDLKPGNILLCPTAEGEPLVKVLDFGLAEISGPRPARRGTLTQSGEDLRSGGELASGACLTATGALVGTPLYVAPELIRQQAASRASDLYSFGVIAYEILAGHPPFQGSMVEVLTGHLNEEPPAPTRLPKAVWEVLQECLRKKAALRPTSASDVVTRARRAAGQTAPKPWWGTRIPRRARLSIGLTLIMLLTGLVLPWSVLLWTEQWLRDLVARSVPAHALEPRSGLTVDTASPEEGSPPPGHQRRQVAEPGGDVADNGSIPLPRPVVSSHPAAGPDAPGLAPQKLVKVGDDQPGAQGHNGALQAVAGPSSVASKLNDLAPPRNATGGDLAPAPPPGDTVSLRRKVVRLLTPKPVAWDFAEPVALIYGIKGEATLTFPSKERQSLRLFDRLKEGMSVEVGRGSRLALAFADGLRYEMGDGSGATLGPAGFSSRTGPVRPLPSVPPLPCLRPQPRFRLDPAFRPRGIPTLAEATTLRFKPVEGRNYRIEVLGYQGKVVYAAKPTTSAVILPSGILQPGINYEWRVYALEGSRNFPFADSAEHFSTLPLRTAEAREGLRRTVEAEGEIDSLALLAEVDRCLGLQSEARNELREVAQGSASAAVLYHLGIVETHLDPTSAEEHLQRALAIQEAQKPRGFYIPDILHQLGLLAWKRGDLRAAEAFLELEIKEKLAQGSPKDLQ